MSFRPGPGRRSGGPGSSPGGESPAEEKIPARGRGRGRAAGRLPVRPGLLAGVVGLSLVSLAVVGGILWLYYGDRAGGAAPFEESVASGAEPVVRVTNERGRVSIKGVSGTESVEVSAMRYARGLNPDSAAENAAGVPVEVSVEEGSGIEISSGGGGGTGVDYDLAVPPGSTVEVESGAGDVEVSGLDGGATVRSGNGDVNVEEARGSILVETETGDISVEGLSTKTGSASITAGSGDVALADVIIGVLETRVGSGDVALSGRFSGGGGILVETGGIDVRVPTEDVKDLEVETRVGRISYDGEPE